MSTAKKVAAPNEYVYGYALTLEGEFYDGSGEFVGLEEARIYSDTELKDSKKLIKEAAEETGQDADDIETVAIVIREVK